MTGIVHRSRPTPQVPARSGLTRITPPGYVVRFRCENVRCALWHDTYATRVWIARGPGGRPECLPVETDRCAGCGEPGELLTDLRAIERASRTDGWEE